MQRNEKELVAHNGTNYKPIKQTNNMENTVIHCETEEEAKIVFSILAKQGYQWCDGDSLTEFSCWGRLKANTCFRIDENNKVNFSNKAYYEDAGYKITPANEFLTQNKRNNMENKAIHCPTEADAKEVFAILNKQGYQWNDWESLTPDNRWDEFKENTCYRIDNHKKVFSFNKKFYEQCGLQIITANEFINNKLITITMKKLISIKHYPSNFDVTYEENEETATRSISYDGLKNELSREEWQEDDFISSFDSDSQEEILNYMSSFYIFNTITNTQSI